MADKPIVNIADLPLTESGHGDRFLVKRNRIGPTLGLINLGCTLHVVPPGKRAFPFHAHHVADELFFIVAGAGECRYGNETFPIRAGDIIGAPAGKTAHQIINTGTDDLRYLGVSTIGSVDVVEYPDSQKFAVAAGVKNADFKTATFVHLARTEKPLDYWDGES